MRRASPDRNKVLPELREQTVDNKEEVLKSNQLKAFKLIVFILGLAVICAAFLIVNLPLPESGLTANQKYFWLNLVVMYLVFFCPLFFSSISTRNIDEKITPAIGVWISVLVFEIVALVLSVSVLAASLSIRTAALVELVLLFLCAVFVYFGYFSGNHIANVQAHEQALLSKIAEVKSAFEMLSLKADTWDGALQEQKEKAKRLCDDVRYLSPVSTEEAARLEQKLVIAASVVSDSHFTPAELDAKLAEIELLIKQRKLIRN